MQWSILNPFFAIVESLKTKNERISISTEAIRNHQFWLPKQYHRHPSISYQIPIPEKSTHRQFHISAFPPESIGARSRAMGPPRPSTSANGSHQGFFSRLRRLTGPWGGRRPVQESKSRRRVGGANESGQNKKGRRWPLDRSDGYTCITFYRRTLFQERPTERRMSRRVEVDPLCDVRLRLDCAWGSVWFFLDGGLMVSVVFRFGNNGWTTQRNWFILFVKSWKYGSDFLYLS